MHSVIKISSTHLLRHRYFFSSIRYTGANCALDSFVSEISGSKIITAGSEAKTHEHLEGELGQLLSAGHSDVDVLEKPSSSKATTSLNQVKLRMLLSLSLFHLLPQTLSK